MRHVGGVERGWVEHGAVDDRSRRRASVRSSWARAEILLHQ